MEKTEGEFDDIEVSWESDGSETSEPARSCGPVTGVEEVGASSSSISSSWSSSSSSSSSSARVPCGAIDGGAGRGELFCACRSVTHFSRYRRYSMLAYGLVRRVINQLVVYSLTDRIASLCISCPLHAGIMSLRTPNSSFIFDRRLLSIKLCAVLRAIFRPAAVVLPPFCFRFPPA